MCVTHRKPVGRSGSSTEERSALCRVRHSREGREVNAWLRVNPDSVSKMCSWFHRKRVHRKDEARVQALKDLNVRPDTIKLLGENTGKTFSYIIHTNVFLGHSPNDLRLGQSPKTREIKAKINKRNLINLASFCIAKQTINKKTAYGPGENICKLYNQQELNF